MQASQARNDDGTRKPFDPLESMARAKHEFGEYGGVNMSIEASTTFTVMKAATLPEIFGGSKTPKGGCFLYSRNFNPTIYNVGREIAALEGTEAGYATGSGMAAISCALMQLCDTGDHIVSSNCLYGGSFALLQEFFPKKVGIHTTFVRITDTMAVEEAIVANPRVKVLYTEAISNPTLQVADLETLATIAHKHGIQFVVDNTFSPLSITPARFGADVVIHSITKFINGASDIIGGVVCGRESFIKQLMDLHTGALMLLGPTMDPRAAFDVAMRIPHLGIRVMEHSRRAMFIATRLEQLLGPELVTYIGLKSHPQHELFNWMRNKFPDDFGYGGLLTIDLGTVVRANDFMDFLQNKKNFGFMAVSLGYAETLMSCSGSSTSSELSEEDKKKANISPGLVRMSIGITGSLEMRWAQLYDALVHVGLVKKPEDP